MPKVKNPHVFVTYQSLEAGTERITFEVEQHAWLSSSSSPFIQLLRTWIRSNTPANEARFFFLYGLAILEQLETTTFSRPHII